MPQFDEKCESVWNHFHIVLCSSPTLFPSRGFRTLRVQKDIMYHHLPIFHVFNQTLFLWMNGGSSSFSTSWRNTEKFKAKPSRTWQHQTSPTYRHLWNSLCRLFQHNDRVGRDTGCAVGNDIASPIPRGEAARGYMVTIWEHWSYGNTPRFGKQNSCYSDVEENIPNPFKKRKCMHACTWQHCPAYVGSTRRVLETTSKCFCVYINVVKHAP